MFIIFLHWFWCKNKLCFLIWKNNVTCVTWCFVFVICFICFLFLKFLIRARIPQSCKQCNKQHSRIKHTHIFIRKVFVGPHFCITNYINILGCYIPLPQLRVINRMHLGIVRTLGTRGILSLLGWGLAGNSFLLLLRCKALSLVDWLLGDRCSTCVPWSPCGRTSTWTCEFEHRG